MHLCEHVCVFTCVFIRVCMCIPTPGKVLEVSHCLLPQLHCSHIQLLTGVGCHEGEGRVLDGSEGNTESVRGTRVAYRQVARFAKYAKTLIQVVIGASLSEPQTDDLYALQFNIIQFICICCSAYCIFYWLLRKWSLFASSEKIAAESFTSCGD